MRGCLGAIKLDIVIMFLFRAKRPIMAEPAFWVAIIDFGARAL